jgi:hypothetical protein
MAASSAKRWISSYDGVCEFSTEVQAGDISRIVFARTWRKSSKERSLATIVVGACSLLLLCVSILLSKQQPHASLALLAVNGVGVLIAVAFDRRRRGPITEKALLFPGVGIQLIDSQERTRYIQASDIECFAINEGFEHCRVVVYLVLVKRDKSCLVLFDETRPPVEGLTAAFDRLDEWLSHNAMASRG